MDEIQNTGRFSEYMLEHVIYYTNDDLLCYKYNVDQYSTAYEDLIEYDDICIMIDRKNNNFVKAWLA